MKTLLPFISATLVQLLGNPAWAEDKVLVPGDPPLTRNAGDQNAALYEWLLGIKLSDADRDRFREAVIKDWSRMSKAAREAEVENARVWRENTGLKDDRRRDSLESFIRLVSPNWRLQVLPKMLDSIGKGTSERDKLLLGVYREAWQKELALRPTAVMEKQPPWTPADDLVLGQDPKRDWVFDRPTVFTGPHVYGDFWYWPSEDGMNRPTVTEYYHHWWFRPNGRVYVRLRQYTGLVNPRGKESASEFWGRYTIENDFRVRAEFDHGEKITVYLINGRKSLLWGQTVYTAPGKPAK